MSEEKCPRCGHYVFEATYESGRKATECPRCAYELTYELAKMTNRMPQCPTCKPEMYGKYYFGSGTTILSRDCRSLICTWCGKEVNRLPKTTGAPVWRNN